MEKQIFITTDFERIDKTEWPPFAKKFLDAPDVNSLHRYSHSKIFFKKFNTDAYPRILFFEEEREGIENVLYVPRKYFKRHDDYSEFLKLDEKTQLQRCRYNARELEEIESKFQEMIEVESKPALPLELRDIENQRDFSNTSTTYVFEMEEWCNHFGSRDFEDDRRLLFEAVQRIVIEKQHAEPNKKGWILEHFSNGKEIALRIQNKDDHTYYYFFDLALKIDLLALENKYRDLTDIRLLKQAKRGFPDWILYGEFEDWKNLENDDDANLALSDEEIEVLNNTPYPYFINGLAGSGKSTILYYLFAHAYSYKSVRQTPMDMLFISYSIKLVDKARNVVKALLRKNPSYHQFNLTDEEEKKLDKCFCPFRDFLINNFIETEEEIQRFATARHISYDLFQKKYESDCKLAEAKSYKAAIVWSIIRTFIKGRDHQKFFYIQDYDNLYASDRTISSKDYENIYRIWKNWYYEQYHEEYWDDLDLVRYVLQKLEKNPSQQKYDIIYCDEAQDFTPIENKLILSLSKYTEYDLQDYRKIPIAYAGDPNQTVSPTGFSWTRLKEIFDRSFIEQIGTHISLREQLLNNNYRSKKTIVEFANSIQYIRKSFLSDDVVNPQEQWNPQANPLPGFFYLRSEQDENLIKRGFEKTECIITGDDGEYEKNLDDNNLTDESTSIDDPLLLAIDNKTKLYTAISSKGLEFKAVILYKFADNLPDCFTKIVNEEEIDRESDKYELAHFFTKLYIAVSRTKEVLYIVDTEENYNKFWNYFFDNAFVNQLIATRQDGEAWKNKVGGIEFGNRDEFLRRLEENFDPLETAKRLKADAMLSQDPKDMNKAAGYFEEGGQGNEAEVCKAYVLLFRKNFKEAGDKFLNLYNNEEAAKAYWAGMCWDELELYGNVELQKLVSKYMKSRIPLAEFADIIRNTDEIRNTNETWRNVVIKIKADAQKVSEDDIHVVCEFLEKLTQQGFSFLNDTIAELYFRNKKYDKAIQKWDSLEKTEHKSYYAAKEVMAQDLSEKVFWMSKGGKGNEILKDFADPALADTFDDRAKRIIFNLLCKPATFKQALNYPINSDNKLNQLRNADPIQFLQSFVLDDFSEESFVTWVENPLKGYDSDFFNNIIPQEVFDKIFSLSYDCWIYFMRLRDNGGYRVMKNDVNLNSVAEAISNALKKHYYNSLASCFLDVLFNQPGYNFANANKYADTIIRIFSSNEFSKLDFRFNQTRNIYFKDSGCQFEVADLDRIKDRLRDFTDRKIHTYKKVKDNQFEEFVTLCRIYEYATPYTPKEGTDKYEYDYTAAMQFYSKLINGNINFSQKLINYFKLRKQIINLEYAPRCTYAKIVKEIGKDFNVKNLCSILDREDAVWFVKIALGGKKCDIDNYDDFFELAKLIYKFDIKRREYTNKTTSTHFMENSIDLQERALHTIMERPRIDIYAIKIVTYIWEAIGEESVETAKRYDTLAKNQRFVKVPAVVDYFHNRALYFYSFGNANLFNKKCREYYKNYSVEEMRRRGKPRIEEENEKGTTTTPTTKMKKISVEKDMVIGGISIEFKASRKTIWFTKDGQDLVTVERGEIKADVDSIKIEGRAFSINKDMRVNVISENLCAIIYNNTLYEIKM